MPKSSGSYWSPDTGRSSGAPTGNLNRQSTGHRAAEKALQRGESFRGLALAKEQEVSAELEIDGVDALLVRDAVRLQVVTDLYFDCVVCASQRGELKSLDRYIARHAGLTSRAISAWQAVREMQRATNHKALDYELVLEQERDEQANVAN